MDENKVDQRAIEEWKILEGVNTRHIDLSFKTRGWMYTLITALTVGLLSGKAIIVWWEFLVISYGLIVLFLGMELIQRAFTAKARQRIAVVESSIRGEIPYDGPRVTEALPLDSTHFELLVEVKPQFVWLPYLLLTVAITLLAIFVR